MGNWGYKPTQSDTFLDVLDTFKTYYHLGDTPEKIEQSILDEYKEIENDDSDMQDLLLGIAYGHWHINSLTAKHLHQMNNIVVNDIGMKLWLEQGQESYNKRKQALINFIEKLKTPRKTILKKKIIKQYLCPFEIGDVLTIKLKDDLYGGILVLTKKGDEPDKRVKYGTQYMVFSAEKFVHKPTTQEVLNSDILYNKESNGYFIRTIYAKDLTKKILKTIQKIGSIKFAPTIYKQFIKGGKCFNCGEIEEYLIALNQPKSSSKFRIKDILKDRNTWNEMLICRYDLMGMDIRKSLENLKRTHNNGYK